MANEISISRSSLAAVTGEFLGTCILALVALVLYGTTPVSYFIGTSVALALAVIYLMFRGVSGGHFNPAITVGAWTAKTISTVRGIAYVVAQVAGGFAAYGLYSYLSHSVPHKSSTSNLKIFLAELIGSIVLAIGFAAAANKTFTALSSAWTYATALFVGVIIASTASAGVLNPALASGLRYWSWIYMVAPLAGGIIGINLYNYLLMPPTKKKK